MDMCDYNEVSPLDRWLEQIIGDMKIAFTSGDIDIMAEAYIQLWQDSPVKDERIREILLNLQIEVVFLELAQDLYFRVNGEL